MKRFLSKRPNNYFIDICIGRIMLCINNKIVCNTLITFWVLLCYNIFSVPANRKDTYINSR